MKTWNCDYCKIILELSPEREDPSQCPVCSNEPINDENFVGKYSWISEEEVLSAFSKGDPLRNIFVETIHLDGETFVHPIQISDSIVGTWSSREAQFEQDVDLSGTYFVSYFQSGAGQSNKLNRFAYGAEFESKLILTGAQFKHGGSFEGCHMGGGISARGFCCDTRLDLSGLEVDQDADFSDTVLDIVILQNARFRSKLIFERIVVKRDFNTIGLSVGKLFLLNSSEFRGDVYIGESAFSGEVNFYKAVFNKSLSLDTTEFALGVELDSATVKGRFDITETDFQGWVDLEWANFKADVYVEGTTFWNVASFEDTIFEGNVTFRIVSFHKEAFFRRAKFRGNLTVIVGRFRDRVDFRDIEFNDELNIERSTFGIGTYFSRSCFHSPVVWNSVAMEGFLQAYDMSINSTLTWKECTFGEDVILKNSVFSDEFSITTSSLNGCFDIRSANFQSLADFTDCDIKALKILGVAGEQVRLDYAQVEKTLSSEQSKEWDIAAAEWELLRLLFEKRNLPLDVDLSYFKKRQMENRSAEKGRVSRIIERIFLEWGTGYSTKPLNVFILSLLIIVFFATVNTLVFRSVVPVDDPETPATFLDALQFSFSTFSQINPSELIVTIEAFIGGFLLAVFTTLLTRKVFRQ